MWLNYHLIGQCREIQEKRKFVTERQRLKTTTNEMEKREGVYHLVFRAPLRDIHLSQPVSTRNSVSRVLSKGNVGTRGLNTLFLQRPIDKRILAHQRTRTRAAFLHCIHHRRVANANVQIFWHRLSKASDRQRHGARLTM
ncbi:hypothetical protein TRVL_08602 [Trypanosoma vivax]|nr:hypothetical protein TRVL_08602 [Trypanosoma vivax]